MLLNQKIESAISLLRKYESMALKLQPFGYHLAFSGGKDSAVVYELCLMSGVKFQAFFYKTSVDPKSLLSFIRNNYPDVIWIRPKLTMYQLILKKNFLPMRNKRYCCDILKERNGLNAVVLTGITKSESPRRALRKEFETSCKLGLDKILLNVIINWSVSDVFNFLSSRNISICSIYKTNSRIGCIGCPMSPAQMRKDFVVYPVNKKAYVNTVAKLMARGRYIEFDNASDVVDWWSSGISIKNYLLRKRQLRLF